MLPTAQEQQQLLDAVHICLTAWRGRRNCPGGMWGQLWPPAGGLDAWQPARRWWRWPCCVHHAGCSLNECSAGERVLVLPEQLLGPVIHQLGQDASLAASVRGVLVQRTASAGTNALPRCVAGSTWQD